MLKVPRVIAHIGDVGCANLACDSTCGKWRVEVGGVLGVEAVDFHLTRAVDILAVLHVDAHVGHTARLGAEEEQVAELAFLPFRSLDRKSVV